MQDSSRADDNLQSHQDEEDDEDDEDEYDAGDTVDDAVLRQVGDDQAQSGLSRVKRACWPPPPPRHHAPRPPAWSPLFRVQMGPSGPSRINPSTSGEREPPPLPGPPGRVAAPAAAPAPRPRPALPPPRPAANPVYGNRMKLFCRTGYHLTIGPKGRVTGTANPDDKYAVLEFSSVTNGEVRIRGVEVNLFLAMNRQGKLYGQSNIRQEGTVFVEMMLGQYNTYLSRKFAHAGWYVGIKKNGRQKIGHKTAWGQKAIQFLPIRVAK